MRAVALTVAYVLVLQVLFAGLFAARMAGEPRHDSGIICLNGPSSTQPTDDGGHRTLVHCPLCTLRLEVALPPVTVQGEPPALPAFSIEWQVAGPTVRLPSLSRAAHHPRGPPAASVLI